MAHERKCVLDGTEYKYCSKCGQYDSTETWRYMFCCENCRDIVNIIPKYNGGGLTKIQAKRELSKFDLTKIDIYNEKFKKIIDEIMSEPEPVVVEEKPLFVSKKKKNKEFVNEIIEEIIPPVEEL